MLLPGHPAGRDGTDAGPSEDLFSTVFEGDLEKTQALLAGGAEPNLRVRWRL
jgi:hypothetical protein